MTVNDALQWGESQLRDAGIDEARLNAELLLGHLLDRDRLELRLVPHDPVPPTLEQRYRAFVGDRATRRPLQYVLGEQELLGLRFKVGPGVLVPRLDTEVLIEAVLKRAHLLPPTPVIVDFGTGSGVLALSLAHNLPAARVFATEISSEALEIARENAQRLGLTQRVTFGLGDLTAPLAEWELERQVDLCVANLPYIPRGQLATLAPEIRNHEPRLALDGGPDGLDLVRRLLDEVSAYLAPRAWLALEIGYDQGAAVTSLLERQAWCSTVELVQDLAGCDRVVLARAAK